MKQNETDLWAEEHRIFAQRGDILICGVDEAGPIWMTPKS